MDAAKGFFQNITAILVFLYLLFLPFGQLLKFPTGFYGLVLNINLIDTISFATIPFYFLKSISKPKISIYFLDFFIIASFSLLLSLNYFPGSRVLFGSLYLLRLISYYTLFVLIWNVLKNEFLKPKLLLKFLMVSLLFAGILGWVQYLLFPDLVALKYLNWDDHLFRLVGTYLDPSFTGIIMIFGVILALNFYISTKKISFFAITVFFTLTILFTYSRASYMALIGGITATFYLNKMNLKALLLPTLVGVFVAALFLPRLASEGTLLERTSSIYARIGEFRQTSEIFKENPLFGIGFNNLCQAKLSKFGDKPGSHSCSGTDSSLLFILVTTGVVGFAIFVNSVIQIYSRFENNLYSIVFKASIVSIFIHSLFVQSIFYTHVMGIISIVLACAWVTRGNSSLRVPVR